LRVLTQKSTITAVCPAALPYHTSLVEGLVCGLQFLCEEATMEDEECFLGMRNGRSTNLSSWYVYTVMWRQKRFSFAALTF